MIKFKLHHLYEDKLDGSARVVFSMGLTDIEKYHEVDLKNLAQAEAYVSDTKRTWILNCLEKFTDHKQKIWANGNHPEQMNAWRICYDSQTSFYDNDLRKICNRFLKGVSYYEKILPNPNNSSYQSSVNNLNMLIEFCKEQTI